MVWSFCHPAALLNLGHKRLNTAFWGWLVPGATLLRKAAHRASHGQRWGIGAVRPESPPDLTPPLLIYTFPLSLGKLPFTAVQQIVAVAGLAVCSVLQHLHTAFNVDESFGL